MDMIHFVFLLMRMLGQAFPSIVAVRSRMIDLHIMCYCWLCMLEGIRHALLQQVGKCTCVHLLTSLALLWCIRVRRCWWLRMPLAKQESGTSFGSSGMSLRLGSALELWVQMGQVALRFLSPCMANPPPPSYVSYLPSSSPLLSPVLSLNCTD